MGYELLNSVKAAKECDPSLLNASDGQAQPKLNRAVKAH